MALAVTEAELRDLLDQVAFTRQYGFTLHAIGDGECTIDASFQEVYERPGGLVSGPVFMAAADVAMWLALMTRLGKDDRSVTAELTTNFLGGARREAFRCRAVILKQGARLVYGTAECRALDGRLLTHHGISYLRPPAPSAG